MLLPSSTTVTCSRLKKSRHLGHTYWQNHYTSLQTFIARLEHYPTASCWNERLSPCSYTKSVKLSSESCMDILSTHHVSQGFDAGEDWITSTEAESSSWKFVLIVVLEWARSASPTQGLLGPAQCLCSISDDSCESGATRWRFLLLRALGRACLCNRTLRYFGRVLIVSFLNFRKGVLCVHGCPSICCKTCSGSLHARFWSMLRSLPRPCLDLRRLTNVVSGADVAILLSDRRPQLPEAPRTLFVLIGSFNIVSMHP